MWEILWIEDPLLNSTAHFLMLPLHHVKLHKFSTSSVWTLCLSLQNSSTIPILYISKAAWDNDLHNPECTVCVHVCMYMCVGVWMRIEMSINLFSAFPKSNYPYWPGDRAHSMSRITKLVTDENGADKKNKKQQSEPNIKCTSSSSELGHWFLQLCLNLREEIKEKIKKP